MHNCSEASNEALEQGVVQLRARVKERTNPYGVAQRQRIVGALWANYIEDLEQDAKALADDLKLAKEVDPMSDKFLQAIGNLMHRPYERGCSWRDIAKECVAQRRRAAATL